MMNVDFANAVADILEVHPVTEDMRFRETPGWCSLKAFGLLVLLENDYGVRLTVDRFLGLQTVGDLYSLVHAG